MPRKAQQKETATPKAEVVVPATPIVESVKVTWRGMEREFSKAIHGNDFRALAQEFCDTNGAVIV